MTTQQNEIQLVQAARQQVAATLAAAIITASARPHSIDEAHEVYQGCFFKLFPQPSFGSYEEWKKKGSSADVHI